MAAPRVNNRKKRRMPCELRVGSRVHSGLVLDLSPTGLFIQTNAKAAAGQVIELTLATGSGDPIPLQVEVVRKKTVPPRLLTLTGGGIGVRIVGAVEPYYGFLKEIGVGSSGVGSGAPANETELMRPGEPDGDGAPDGEGDAGDEATEPRFRVRVKQVSGPRSRRIEVAAPDSATASELALEAVGDDWKVLDVEPL